MLITTILSAAVVTLAARATNADTGKCVQSLTQFRAAQTMLISEIEAYEQCARSSDTSNDCAYEYGALGSGQSAFHDAVADFGKVCHRDESVTR